MRSIRVLDPPSEPERATERVVSLHDQRRRAPSARWSAAVRNGHGM